MPDREHFEDPVLKLIGRRFHARAYAKVNLHLGCGEVRDDGYHDLVTVFQSVEIADDVIIEVVDSVSTPQQMFAGDLEVTGPHAAGVPVDSSNLVWKAIYNVLTQTQRCGNGIISWPQLRVRIVKNIPTAGGMAGGSADAAAALVAANALVEAWEWNVDPLFEDDMAYHAARLGADVPFSVMGGTALGVGRGDELATVLSRGEYHWCFIASKEGLSTPAVFAKLDDLRSDTARQQTLQPHLNHLPVAQALLAGDAQQLATAMHNDLQPAALSLRPELRKIIELGEDSGALRGIVSGSGPTIALLCPSLEAAREVRDIIVTEIPGTRGFTATGPAGGAHLVDGTEGITEGND